MSQESAKVFKMYFIPSVYWAFAHNLHDMLCIVCNVYIFVFVLLYIIVKSKICLLRENFSPYVIVFIFAI